MPFQQNRAHQATKADPPQVPNATCVRGQPSFRYHRKNNCRELYFQVTDNIVAMLNDGFADRKHFAFLDLLNPNFSARWKAKFPGDMLQVFMLKFGPYTCNFKPIAFYIQGQ